MSRRLDDVRLVVLMLDGIELLQDLVMSIENAKTGSCGDTSSVRSWIEQRSSKVSLQVAPRLSSQPRDSCLGVRWRSRRLDLGVRVPPSRA